VDRLGAMPARRVQDAIDPQITFPTKGPARYAPPHPPFAQKAQAIRVGIDSDGFNSISRSARISAPRFPSIGDENFSDMNALIH